MELLLLITICLLTGQTFGFGETDESLEKERELLYEYKKTDNNRVIHEKMANTFSLRRQDVIQKPPVVDLYARWPALFEIEEEFRRIKLKPLQSTFIGKLDEHSAKFLRLYKRKRGAVGKKLDETLEIMNEVCGDDDSAAIQEAITTFVLNIFVVSKAKGGGLEKQAGIAIEGAEVLFGISSVAHACTYLMGLIYALELSYPQKLKYTFEVLQKLELEDVNKNMSSKVHDLKISLLA